MEDCLRFLSNLKVPKDKRQIGPLSANELDNSMKYLVKLSQIEDFNDVINTLKIKEELNSQHKLLNLSLFHDDDNLIRV